MTEPVILPRDHASHPEFAIEWWYFTANVTSKEGLAIALQWTLFRLSSSLPTSPWSDGQMFMSHAKIMTVRNTWFDERFARSGVGNAGVRASPFTAYLDNWQWLSNSASLLPAQLTISPAANVKADLHLDSDAPFIRHGHDGISPKTKDGKISSYYYSQPAIDVSGIITLGGSTHNVTGVGWFDHEWTSQYLHPDALGWDWFALHLHDGSKLMLFAIRENPQQVFWQGTFVDSSGQQHSLTGAQISAQILAWHSVQGRRLPLEWDILVPEFDLALSVTPMKTDQWNQALFAYYEGAINISGSHQGVGFMELTGY